MKDPILLIDGNNVSLKALHTPTEQLTDGDQNQTACIFISLKTIFKIAKYYRPLTTIWVWDGGHDKRRKQLYSEYKQRSTLKQQDEEKYISWKQQCSELETYLPLLGISQLRLDGWEADDIIAILSNHLANQEYNVSIVSTDKDFYQLLNPRVEMFNTYYDQAFSHDMIKELYGIDVSSWLKYKALIGDSSDNITNIKGIGEKKAKLILEHCDPETYLLMRQATGEKFNKWEIDLRDKIDIYHRNLKLMDLRNSYTDEQVTTVVDYFQSQFSNTQFNPQEFHKICMKRQFITLIEDRMAWNLCSQV